MGTAPRFRESFAESISVWRVTQGPNNDWPLAICDYSTIDLNDLESTDVIHKERIGESLRLYHNRSQRWYYLSDQNTDEVTIFRNTDSRGTHIPCKHTRSPSNSVVLKELSWRAPLVS